MMSLAMTSTLAALRLGAIILFVFSVGLSVRARAADLGSQWTTELPKSTPVKFHWISPEGVRKSSDWQVQSVWTWRYEDVTGQKIKEPATLAIPIQRYYVQIPLPLKLTEVTATRAVIDRSPGGNPFTERKGTLVALESEKGSPAASVTFHYLDAAGKPDEVSSPLTGGAEGTESGRFLSPSCADLQVTALSSESATAIPRTTLSCADFGTRIRVIVAKPPAVSVEAAAPAAFLDQADHWALLEFVKPVLMNKPDDAKMGQFALRSGGVRETVTLSYSSANARKHLIITPNAGFTYVNYNESLVDMHLSQLGITGKANGAYPIFPGKLIADATLYSTLVPIVLSPRTASPAWFLGGNIRLSYRIPLKREDPIVHGALGYYVVSMIVPGRGYGYSYLMGPQFFGSIRKILYDRTLGAYLKYAPLSDSFFINSLANFELALGGSFQVTRPGAQRPFFVTLDLSYMQANSQSQGNSLSLFSVSIGGQTSFSFL